MKYTLKTIAAVLAIAPLYAYAGGDPEHVKFPDGYEKTFTKYATMNRANQTQVAKLYANDAAVSSYTQGKKSASGSIPRKMLMASQSQAVMVFLKLIHWRQLP